MDFARSNVDFTQLLLQDLLPETLLFVGVVVNFILSIWIKKPSSLFTLFIGLCALIALYQQDFAAPAHDLASGMLHIQTSGQQLRMLSLLALILHSILSFCQPSTFSISSSLSTSSSSLTSLSSSRFFSQEVYVLTCAIALGAQVLVLSNHFLLWMLGLELVSLSSYILVGLSAYPASSESASRYILYGLLATGLFLFGITYAYGATGLFYFREELFLLRVVQAPSLWVQCAFGFMAIGICFKLSLAPMQWWVPDVYQGAQPIHLGYFSFQAKLAGVAMLLGILPALQTLQPVLLSSEVLTVLVFMSLLLGNFPALLQVDVKRMLGYSAIAHAGFLLLPLCVSLGSFNAVVYYLFAYLLMNIAVFAILALVENDKGEVKIQDFNGLGMQNPLLAVAITVVFISLAGLPPTLGFLAKLGVFASIFQSDTTDKLSIYLGIFAIFNTVIGLFYYLKIPYALWFKPYTVKMVSAEQSSFNKLSFAIILLAFLLLASFFAQNWVHVHILRFIF